jgi:hypothetical protein
MDIIVEPTTVIRTRKDGTILVDETGQAKTTKRWGAWVDKRYVGAFRTKTEARREATRVANDIHVGDTVIYQGQPHTVTSVKLGDIAGPHVRMMNINTGKGEDLTSVSLVHKMQS